jgi:hypothetical protein
MIPPTKTAADLLPMFVKGAPKECKIVATIHTNDGKHKLSIIDVSLKYKSIIKWLKASRCRYEVIDDWEADEETKAAEKWLLLVSDYEIKVFSNQYGCESEIDYAVFHDFIVLSADFEGIMYKDVGQS